jgi:integrase
MPLKLRPPRAGKTPNYEIRGTYRHVHVEVSSGTNKRSDALKELKRIETVIDEHGQYPAPAPAPRTGEPTFLSAAVAYMQATGQRRGIARLIKHFGEKPLSEMTQDAIDKTALALSPNVTPATRSRYVYTPVSAIMHLALGENCPAIKHKYGGKGKERTDFMWPDDAFAIIAEADKIDIELGTYLLTLLYTGIRKSEGLALLPQDTRPEELTAWLKTSKNEDPRMLRLREDLAQRLRAHLEQHPNRERLFKFKEGGHFKHLLLRATMAACGLECPKRRPTGWKKPKFRLGFVTFHVFRHTWATWLRYYGGADVQGLVATKNWRDERSARRYSHVVPRDEWARVNSLPSAGNIRGKASNE